MAVYVDNYGVSYGRMTMSHMIADTPEELLAMADKIGVNRRWLQEAGTYKEHFDICKSKRALAVRHGAIELSIVEFGRKLLSRNDRGRALLARLSHPDK
jgi:hypothetical protein